MKPNILMMIALVVFGCANHKEARRKSVQLYPGLPQRQVVSLFGMPNKAEGNPDEGNPSGDYEMKTSFRDRPNDRRRSHDAVIRVYDPAVPPRTIS